jgi:ribonuclease-3
MIQDPGRLESKLGYRFKDPALLSQALTHRSAGRQNNERLEFLGDAILDLVIAECLFERYSSATEGELSRMRANLVNREVLAEIAGELELGQFLQLGLGERKSGGKRRVSILADSVEALIAAIYLESGLPDTTGVVKRLFEHRMLAGDIAQPRKDSKTRLQELMQSRGLALPSYDIQEVLGEAHDQTFSFACSVALLAEPLIGRGRSKRMAEQDAAEQALARLEDRP